ncbi:MAG: hypothetical protein A2Y25_01825 [Candidatus Melainabacteria bacterium GWF2_37_15]|nr:MAG: hypothetical protein A2Y25_01825 [Candidatus Melainabacteria bacterium GWF2_37_15]
MSILESFNVGESGMSAHAKRLEVHAKNIANIDTPYYVRKIPTLTAQDDISFSGVLNHMKESVFHIGTIPHTSGKVYFSGVVGDSTPGELQYAPDHPEADENGFIRRSNVNPMVDMADSILTSRAYEASLAVVTIAKTMAQKAVEIGR